jgi:hypothetical protein
MLDRPDWAVTGQGARAGCQRLRAKAPLSLKIPDGWNATAELPGSGVSCPIAKLIPILASRFRIAFSQFLLMRQFSAS